MTQSPRTRSIVQALVFLAIAICIARLGPVRRYYALHAPVWAARGKVAPRSTFAAQVVAGARAQIGTTYDERYQPIAYPNGDVSPNRGACSDVVVRAFRNAGVDLQRLIHEDMLAGGSAYPKLSSSGQADSNIDHRRCANQMEFFRRHGLTLTTEVPAATRDQWQPGDVVYWRRIGERRHVGIVSDRTNAQGLPLVIENGDVCIERDCLTDWEIIGHFRYAPE